MGIIKKLNPSPSFKIWGGQNLSKIKNLHGKLPLGETWEISTHNEGSSFLEGTLLSDLSDLSYLFKYIDTSDNLSIQVHPDDEYAAAHENQRGKTECWIILNANPGSGIYLGLKKGTTKKEFKTAIENGLMMDKFLNFCEVKPGDFFYVPAGSIHAIGKNVTLAEVQQSSGVTYRVWDWNRVEANGLPRQLHIDKALDVINFEEEFNQKLLKTSKNIFQKSGVQKVVDHPEFKADVLSLRAGESKEVKLVEKEGLSLLTGTCLIDGEDYQCFDSGITIKAGLFKIVAKKDSQVILIRE